MKRRQELLSRPRTPRRRLSLGVHYDPDQFGEFSERIARFLGTARYLVWQTIVIALWVILNSVAWAFRWDDYPFIFLTLVLSMQAAYAAPLILLAQNRQADRDRAQSERDRSTSARTQADAEYLTRELAATRIRLESMASEHDVADLHEKLDTIIEHLEEKKPAK